MRAAAEFGTSRTKARSASRVSPTSPIRWPPPPSSPTCTGRRHHHRGDPARRIEDTPTPKDQLAARFGADVAELVDGVTKLDQIRFKSREEAQAESSARCCWRWCATCASSW